MPEGEAGRHQGHATAARRLLFSYPSLSSPLPSILSLPLSGLFTPAEKFLPPLGDSAGLQGGRQAGEAQTTCMQLGPAWRGGEQKALKDRTGQSQTDGRTDGLALPLSSPTSRWKQATRPGGRVQSRRECGRGTAVVARPPARPRPLAPTLTCSKSYLGRASQRSFRSEPCLVTTLHIR